MHNLGWRGKRDKLAQRHAAAECNSVVETCRRMKVAVRDYLAAVLPGLADVSIQRVAELTPSAWQPKSINLQYTIGFCWNRYSRLQVRS